MVVSASLHCSANSSSRLCSDASTPAWLRVSGSRSTARLLRPNAGTQSRVPREQLPQAAKVSRTAQEYLLEIDTENESDPPDPPDSPHSPPGKPPSLIDTDGKVSTSDPDAAWASKGGPLHLSYYDNYLIDNASNIIVDVEATPARTSQEIVAARRMLDRVASKFGVAPTTLGADKSYGPDHSWLG